MSLKHVVAISLCIMFAGCEVQNSQTSAGTIQAQWVYTIEKTDEDAPDYTPVTRLGLQLSGAVNEEIEIGSYIGSPGNLTEDGAWDDAPLALMTTTSWWAGGGDEYSVYRNSDGALEIRHRVISEVGLDENGEIFEDGYGPFEVVKTMPMAPSLTLIPR